jgi:hypothetical protein
MTVPWAKPQFPRQAPKSSQCVAAATAVEAFFVRSDENRLDRDRGAAQTFLCLGTSARLSRLPSMCATAGFVQQCFFMTHKFAGAHSMSGNPGRPSGVPSLAFSVVLLTAGPASSGTHEAKHDLANPNESIH